MLFTLLPREGPKPGAGLVWKDRADTGVGQGTGGGVGVGSEGAGHPPRPSAGHRTQPPDASAKGRSEASAERETFANETSQSKTDDGGLNGSQRVFFFSFF